MSGKGSKYTIQVGKRQGRVQQHQTSLTGLFSSNSSGALFNSTTSWQTDLVRFIVLVGVLFGWTNNRDDGGLFVIFDRPCSLLFVCCWFAFVVVGWILPRVWLLLMRWLSKTSVRNQYYFIILTYLGSNLFTYTGINSKSEQVVRNSYLVVR